MRRWSTIVLVAVALAGCRGAPPSANAPSEPASATPTAASSTPATTPSAPPSPTQPESSAPPATPTGELASDPVYGVAFSLPDGWARHGEVTTRWEGDDGFAQVDAVSDSAGSAVDVCNALAEHALQPYGSSPTIEALLVDGQEACLVLPSDDQPPEVEHESAIVAAYPQPREIGGETYEFVTFYVDEPHVRAIAASVRFIT